MTITWKDENQGGPIEDKIILIQHSQFYTEETTVKKLRAEKERLTKLVSDSGGKLTNTNGKLDAAINILNIE